MKKGNWKYSAYHGKCPKCNVGDLWVNKRSYKKGFTQMHDKCSNCELVYDLEQGFWYGAMYISYAMGVAVVVSIVVALSVLTNFSVFEKSGVASLVLVILMPILFRYSRSLWINIFVRFDDKKI